ncbi:hypothetical protein CRG98_007747 [Punica granatum]|uniref:Uncharacterized protein n=1 Tax=Punica granatum TaxID=22663 RepID=A0A2I0KTV5_PUNGR|nr:hypothetical protein CRG98_007747 [Punica granatum]
MAVLYKKLRNLKRHLKDFNRSKFGDVHKRVADLKAQLAQVQAFILGSDSVSSDMIKKEIDLRVELLQAIDKEEKLLKQKLRVAWLQAGDQNTSFFHKAVKARTARTVEARNSLSESRNYGLTKLQARRRLGTTEQEEMAESSPRTIGDLDESEIGLG